ncbi:hypothetical protein MLD38_026288 [Melastoma candidum]|uniref:Uncharacterized protein n=1 Tax=Melastoma candidum TaxID=119954 RepID=A0ACB9NXV7_9MYRT|nr:hypothetical protein MLD38_026288 [Melastoma candidum]
MVDLPMGFIHLLFFSVVSSSSVLSHAGHDHQGVGINYGQLGNNLPVPSRAVHLLRTELEASIVKLYGADPGILAALANTGVEVMIMVPNNLIVPISPNQSLADEWVRSNLLPHYPRTRIRHLLVGNEILSDPTNKDIWFNLVPAMMRIQAALEKYEVKEVKVGTSMAIDVLENSAVYPPSNATFRRDILRRVVRPMLEFLQDTRSFYYFDVYTYFHWIKDPKKIGLDYALLKDNVTRYTDPASGLVYSDLFDQMVDSVVFAMRKLGYTDIPIFIAETGWPNSGDYDQIGANYYNSATYNRNLVRKLATGRPIGTPARPRKPMRALIFALFNENMKGGPSTERHFGLLYPNGSRVYDIDLSGRTIVSAYGPLPLPKNNDPYKGKIWCVAADSAGNNETALRLAVTAACGHGKGSCREIEKGGPCYGSGSQVVRASYAFSAYWARARESGVSCYFGGLAAQTIRDPSYGSCKFPSVSLTGTD